MLPTSQMVSLATKSQGFPFLSKAHRSPHSKNRVLRRPPKLPGEGSSYQPAGVSGRRGTLRARSAASRTVGAAILEHANRAPARGRPAEEGAESQPGPSWVPQLVRPKTAWLPPSDPPNKSSCRPCGTCCLPGWAVQIPPAAAAH